MPGIMTLAADEALYLSSNVYVNVTPAWLDAALGVTAVPPGGAKPCGPTAMRYCDGAAANEYQNCSAVDCESLCADLPRSPLCSGCLQERVRCRERVLAEYADCGTCPAGTNCMGDIGLQLGASNWSRCCPAGQSPCNGDCRSIACMEHATFSRATCRCECDDPFVLLGGACFCPPMPCPPDRPILGDDCVCHPCPPPSVSCDGNCTLLDNDAQHCGDCAIACGRGEACCTGHCTPLWTNGRCGSCRVDCTSPFACCDLPTGGKDCVDLQSDPQHCGACGTVCGLNQGCCNGQCTPLYTNGRCGSCRTNCTTPFACCDGPKGGHECADLRSDLHHCGACDQPCSDFLGMTCVNGTCVCKPRHTPCGPDACCGPGWNCFLGMTKGSNCDCRSGITCGPGDECCAAGEACCGNACTPLGTPNHCHSCTDSCEYYLTTNPDDVQFGPCDAQHLCRCPAGSIAVRRGPAGDDVYCCPAAAPHLCPDGFCHPMPC